MSRPSDIGRRVYITGALGFVGRHAARLFKQKGWQVIGLGRQSLPLGEHERWGIDHHFAGNIAPHLLAHAHDTVGAPDVIVHAAGASSVRQSADDPYGEIATTVGATAAVIEYMREWAPRGRLIYISSAAVYGNITPDAIGVDAPKQPISVYGLHKKLCEDLAIGARGIFGLDTSIIRFFSLYGPGLTKQLLWDVVRRVGNGESHLTLGGTGKETRDFMYVEDGARLIVTIAEQGHTNLVLNGATGHATSVDEIVRLVIGNISPKPTISYTNINRPGDPMRLVADVSCLQGVGFAPETDLAAGVATFVKWACEETGFRRGLKE